MDTPPAHEERGRSRPPWEPEAQYEAIWHLEPGRGNRRPRLIAIAGAVVLVLIVGAWVGYLAGSGESGWPPPAPQPSQGATATAGSSTSLDAAVAPRLSTTILVGGSEILATASARAHPAPAVCPPGSDPDVPGPTDQPRPDPAGSFAWRAAFHEPSGRMIMLDTSSPSDPQAWAFDVCRNSWQELTPPPADIGFVDDLVYDADSALLVAFGTAGDPPWTWDVASDTWTPPAREPGWILVQEGSPRVYDPASGLILGRSDSGLLAAFDVERGRWTPVRQAGEAPVGYGVLVADATTRHVVLLQPVLLGTQGHRVAIWRFEPRTGRWTYDWSPSGEPIQVPWPPAIAHDAASGITVMVGQTIELAGQGARVTEVLGYEPGYIERMYLGTDDGIAHCTSRAIVYDSVNQRVVCAGSVRYSFDPRGRLVGITDVTAVTAFDVARRTWVRLQEP